MTEYRKARPDERTEYIAFADMVFTEDGSPISFERSIPKMYGCDVDSASMNYIAKDSEKGIRGLVAVLPGQMHIGENILKTAYIGTVSTHPQARGEGHMRKLMALTKDEIDQAGTDIAILNGRRQRYAYYGYTPGGVGYTFEVNADNMRHSFASLEVSGISFSEIHEGSLDEAEAEKIQRGSRAWYERKRFAVYCKTYLNTLYGVYDKETLIGYIVANEKSDRIFDMRLKCANEIPRVLKAWFAAHDFWYLYILQPEWEREQRRVLGTFAEHVHISENVNVRIIHYVPVLQALLTLKSQYMQLENGRMELEIEGETFTIEIKDNVINVREGADEPVSMTRMEAQQMILSLADYDGRPETPFGWFPLPVFAAPPDEF